MCLGARVRHGVEGQGDIETVLISLTGRRLDASPGGDTGDDDLGNAQRL